MYGKNLTVGFIIRDMKHDGCYPLDNYQDHLSYWIPYITENKIKEALEQESDKR